MKYVDPATNPNLWLEMTLIKLIEENKPENAAVIKQALHVIIHWLEPGLIVSYSVIGSNSTKRGCANIKTIKIRLIINAR